MPWPTSWAVLWPYSSPHNSYARVASSQVLIVPNVIVSAGLFRTWSIYCYVMGCWPFFFFFRTQRIKRHRLRFHSHILDFKSLDELVDAWNHSSINESNIGGGLGFVSPLLCVLIISWQHLSNLFLSSLLTGIWHVWLHVHWWLASKLSKSGNPSAVASKNWIDCFFISKF